MERRKSGGEYEERVGSEKRKNERKIGVGQRRGGGGKGGMEDRGEEEKEITSIAKD